MKNLKSDACFFNKDVVGMFCIYPVESLNKHLLLMYVVTFFFQPEGVLVKDPKIVTLDPAVKGQGMFTLYLDINILSDIRFTFSS